MTTEEKLVWRKKLVAMLEDAITNNLERGVDWNTHPEIPGFLDNPHKAAELLVAILPNDRYIAKMYYHDEFINAFKNGQMSFITLCGPEITCPKCHDHHQFIVHRDGMHIPDPCRA